MNTKWNEPEPLPYPSLTRPLDAAALALGEIYNQQPKGKENDMSQNPGDTLPAGSRKLQTPEPGRVGAFEQLAAQLGQGEEIAAVSQPGQGGDYTGVLLVDAPMLDALRGQLWAGQLRHLSFWAVPQEGEPARRDAPDTDGPAARNGARPADVLPADARKLPVSPWENGRGIFDALPAKCALFVTFSSAKWGYYGVEISMPEQVNAYLTLADTRQLQNVAFWYAPAADDARGQGGGQ